MINAITMLKNIWFTQNNLKEATNVNITDVTDNDKKSRLKKGIKGKGKPGLPTTLKAKKGKK